MRISLSVIILLFLCILSPVSAATSEHYPSDIIVVLVDLGFVLVAAFFFVGIVLFTFYGLRKMNLLNGGSN